MKVTIEFSGEKELEEFAGKMNELEECPSFMGFDNMCNDSEIFGDCVECWKESLKNSFHVRVGAPDHRKTPVIQYDETGKKKIARFESVSEAARATGTRTGGICACCMGRAKTAGGYVWRYEPRKKTI